MNAYRSLRTLQRCLSCRLPRLTIARPSSTWLPALAPQPIRITPPQCTSYSRHICASSYGTEGAEVEEGYEEVEVELPAHCPGCGVRLQQEDPNAAGFFQVPKKLIDMLSNPQDYLQDLDEDVEEEAEAPEPAEHSPDSDELDAAAEEEGMVRVEIPDGDPAWDTFDNLVESWLETASSPSKKPREPHVKSFADQEADDDIVSGVMCARCYSLRHYGKVKSAEAESDLPEFDIARMVGRRIALQKFRRSVVLVVVDLADFDGSLPRTAVRLLLPPELREVDASQRLPSGFRLVVAANKADLLPSQVTEARLQAWVRRRMAQGGLPRPSAVHIVSSEKGRGVKALLADLQTAVGTRGDVWVIGAQNAGKSSLINAMRRAVGLREGRQVTAAPLPGTTLGVVPVPSLLPRGCKMLDTPGVPHTYQLAAYMTPEEMRMILPRRPLKPRTFRIPAGQSVTIGGVARVDVLESPTATLYLTAWISDQVVCHMGKTDGAAERYAKHAGTKLMPPVGGEERFATFPALRGVEVEVTGDSWRQSSVDVAISGLGWVGVGLVGTAKLKVWAPPGVAVTSRDALMPDMAHDLERPGFGAAMAQAGDEGDGKQKKGAGGKGGKPKRR